MITYSISNKDLNQAFHISGQRFTLTYTFNHANSSESGFLLFVSAVTESNTTTSVGCRLPQINSTSQRTIFTNINYKDGYQPNQKCVSDVTLPEKHEARLYISEYDFEGPADQLILTYGNSEQIPLTWKPRKARYFYKLTSDINDAKLNFISDGNIQGAGYTIIANSSCPDSYFSIALNNYMRDSIDYLIITNNGKMTENITAASGHLNRYFSSKNNSVTIQFHSGPSSDPVTIEDKMWSISVSTMVAPVFVTKTLNETIPKYVQWLSDMGENDALTICTTSGTLEMFVSYIKDDFDLSNVLLYDGGDLNNFVGRGYSALFRIAEEASKNCQNPNNVFQAPSDFLTVSEFDASISSTQSGACEMTILASVGYTSLLPHVWISNISASTNAKYLVYSTVNEKKLFEFNGTEASQWQYVGIYSPAVTIKASASSTISIRLSEVYQTLEWINVVMNGTQKGIMASPSYSGSIRTYNFGSFYQSNGYSKFLTTFNVKEIDGNAKPILQNGGKNQTLTQGIYNTSGAFVLYYEETDPSKNAFLIDYTIQSGPLNPPNSAIMSSFLNTYFIFVLSALFFVLNI
uniref:CUB domain-containing protein n=1 Tax=Panagrolaimus sp. ES5 TaxID=591445 RepID=A0AC34FI73_9BILA